MASGFATRLLVVGFCALVFTACESGFSSSGYRQARLNRLSATLLNSPSADPVARLQYYHQAIRRFALPLDQAQSIAFSINSGLLTEGQYIEDLLSKVKTTTIPAVAVEASMYGIAGTSAEIDLLSARFLPSQVSHAVEYGYEPVVYACEVLGLVFAFANEVGSTRFSDTYGPANLLMPNSSAGDMEFAKAAAREVFGTDANPGSPGVIAGWVSNWKSFYSTNGIPGIPSPTPDQIAIAARGAAWGDTVGIALSNNLGSLPGQVSQFLRNAAQGMAVYSTRLPEAPAMPLPTPTPAPIPTIQAGVLSFPEIGPSAYSTGMKTATLPQDVKITKIIFDYDLDYGGVADYCVFIARPSTTYVQYLGYNGGYSDVLCTNPIYYGPTGGHFHKELDFSSTPLYLPADTMLVCGTSGGTYAATYGARNCQIFYEPIQSGDVLHRILRMPYQDTSFQPYQTMTRTSFNGTSQQPLKVKGFLFYDGVIGTYNGCIEHVSNSTGVLLEQSCMAGSKDFVSNSDSTGINRVNWLIGAGESLAARCDVNAQIEFDCAFYALAEIPSSVKRGPENVFRDYGNIPRANLQGYCTDFVMNYAIASQANMLCGGAGVQAPCSQAVQIQSCMSMYPPASCMNATTGDSSACWN